jgi:hypothetical protein
MKNMDLKPALGWDVTESPILLYDGTPVNDYKALVRNDTNLPLCVTSKKYTPFTNHQFATLSEEIGKIAKFSEINYQEVKDGKIVLAYLKNPDSKMKIGGFQIKDYMITGNSFNGQTGLFLGTSNIVLRCANQFGRIYQGIRIRHTVNISERVEALKQTVQMYFDERDRMYQKMEMFTNVKVDDEIIDECILYVLNLHDQEKLEDRSTRRNNQIRIIKNHIIAETAEVGQNAWGLFSGFTHFTTHGVNQRKNNTFGNLFGSVGSINERAFEFAEMLLK